MIQFSDLKVLGTRAAGRGLLLSKNYSPEVLTTVGIVGIVGAAFLASRATLKLEPAVDKMQLGIETVHEVSGSREVNKNYTTLDRNKDIAYVYMHGVYDIGKLYGPAITLGVGSIVCIVSANGIMRKRNLALMAAYKAVESSFSEYRKRVVEEYGPEKDADYRRGFRDVHEVDEKGKALKKTVTKVDPNGFSPYARFFDQFSTNWVKTPEYNLLFVRCQQNYANDLLHSRGHVFLNEVYDMLGIDRTQAGSVVGWVVTKDGENYVDFGIYDFNNERARAFVNGYEHSILLDFNVYGVIYDQIEKKV